MMPRVKRAYKAAMKDKEFQRVAKDADPEGYIQPSMWSSHAVKITFAAVYYGYLVALYKNDWESHI